MPQSELSASDAFVYISAVEEESPAKAAGLAAGDFVVQIGKLNKEGTEEGALPALREVIVAAHEKGAKVEFIVLRGTPLREVKCTLKPKKWSGQGLTGAKFDRKLPVLTAEQTGPGARSSKTSSKVASTRDSKSSVANPPQKSRASTALAGSVSKASGGKMPETIETAQSMITSTTGILLPPPLFSSEPVEDGNAQDGTAPGKNKEKSDDAQFVFAKDLSQALSAKTDPLREAKILPELPGDEEPEVKLPRIVSGMTTPFPAATDIADLTPTDAFLFVAKVEDKSPSSSAGLLSGDMIVQVGTATKATLTEDALSALRSVVQAAYAERNTLRVVVFRGHPLARTELTLEPREWGGQGLTGAKFVKSIPGTSNSSLTVAERKTRRASNKLDKTKVSQLNAIEAAPISEDDSPAPNRRANVTTPTLTQVQPISALRETPPADANALVKPSESTRNLYNNLETEVTTLSDDQPQQSAEKTKAYADLDSDFDALDELLAGLD